MQVILNFRKVDGFATPADPFEGIATPVATPLRTPMPDFASAFQNMALTKTPQPNAAMIPNTHHTPSAMGVPIPQQFALYPWLYRSQVSPVSPLVFDAVPQRSHSMTAAMPGNYPLVGSLLPQSPTPSTSQSFNS